MCSKDPSQLRDHTARGCQDDCWYRRTRPSSSSSSMAISTTSDRRSLLRLTRFRSIAASGPLSAPHSLWARELGKYSSLSDHSYLPCLSPFLARRNNLLFIALLPNHYLLLFIQAKRLLSKVFLFFFFLASGFSFSYAYSFSVLLHVSALAEIFTHSFHVWSSLWLRMWKDSLDSAVFVFRLLMTHRGQECAY